MLARERGIGGGREHMLVAGHRRPVERKSWCEALFSAPPAAI